MVFETAQYRIPRKNTRVFNGVEYTLYALKYTNGYENRE